MARRLYTFNVQLSTALYGPLHMFEIALRNVTDRKMTADHGVDWLDDRQQMTAYGQSQVQKARDTLTRQNKIGTHSQLVAELNFGFWVGLYSRQSQHLWQGLRPIFQAPGIQRRALHGQLDELRSLRNRIAHYEPIIHLPLAQLYGNLTSITGWLSPSAAAWTQATSTWAAVYPGVPILVPVPDGQGLQLDAQAVQALPAV
ncbi:Abi family protein [Aureimonas ureilytica]|uniref:Abi family protein n=1 Tax=Aureimonas ureilytica TaxID=401562 RepID=UPI000AED6DB4|nr:Abi family protein [Aureimonas ureilytica]